MESRAKFMGHSIHQMLVVFPLGLLATSVFFDLIYLYSKSEQIAVVAYWMLASGIIGGLIAAPFGFIDWLAIPPNTRAKKIGALHGGGNLVVVLLFLSGWLVRYNTSVIPSGLALAFSFAGIALALCTAWLGGELVNRLGIGVDDNANVDAPSSLRQGKAHTRL